MVLEALENGAVLLQGRWQPERRAAQKRKREDIDYFSVDRQPLDPDYNALAAAQLNADFAKFHRTDVRRVLQAVNGLYAPAFKECYLVSRGDAEPREHYRLRPLVRPRASGAGVVPLGGRARNREFADEHAWTMRWKDEYEALNPLPVVKPIFEVPASPMRQEIEDQEEMTQSPASVAIYSPPPSPASLPQSPAYSDPYSPARSPVQSPDTNDFLSPHFDRAPDKSFRYECACCFTDDCVFTELIQCEEGHLFCQDCVAGQTKSIVGDRKTDVLCMDQSGCRAAFHARELARCVDERTLALLDRIRQDAEIAAAGLGALERCPFCPFAMEIEFGTDDVPLFTCLNAECAAVSCRTCKKQDHPGRPCRDEEDERLAAQHKIEEAMTQALIRRCPKPGCNTQFTKESGCNRMRCTSCGSEWCYVCRQIISNANPYDHFMQPESASTCPKWDEDGGDGGNPAQRHEREVAEAERRARAEIEAQAQGGEERQAEAVREEAVKLRRKREAAERDLEAEAERRHWEKKRRAQDTRIQELLRVRGQEAFEDQERERRARERQLQVQGEIQEMAEDIGRILMAGRNRGLEGRVMAPLPRRALPLQPEAAKGQQQQQPPPPPPPPTPPQLPPLPIQRNLQEDIAAAIPKHFNPFVDL